MRAGFNVFDSLRKGQGPTPPRHRLTHLVLKHMILGAKGVCLRLRPFGGRGVVFQDFDCFLNVPLGFLGFPPVPVEPGQPSQIFSHPVFISGLAPELHRFSAVGNDVCVDAKRQACLISPTFADFGGLLEVQAIRQRQDMFKKTGGLAMGSETCRIVCGKRCITQQ